ncbi:xanthine dehydrogenase accessory protein XdhC [Paraburkholderia silvatlantica]|uniref:Xanthine dehydrogenase accessory factor n=1 Tax=Paraburkholderia silvatlantica TaxID=321895 RepID=A0ABR6FRN7_9BURK|nr:xanthine dehydrogenase accessory protein XdhC [Paraburkholderia silvatlantica]MBB2930102.1 xanthine dehydrogenase accessory factor [Paraburkholderia silvatlantica]PVY22443.1 molybdenum cofactor sulfurylase [Paraburkholderia silvatlantica]PXW28912.1 molybdenum cofactor sulfurylase [Paraburkholderia silvatlantica]
MQPWLSDLQQLLAHGDAAVLVTVARVEGSAPREAGTKMIVTREAARHTIGGGHLEWKAIEIARQVLRDGMRTPHARRLERLALGPSLGQCCGGAVVLAFERLDVADLGWLATLARRLAAGASTVRSVSFRSLRNGSPEGVGSAADPAMLSEPEPGVEAPDCLLWETGGALLLTETIAPNDFPVVLFGAGHVGAALVRVLGTLPCRVLWVDERDAAFPAPEAFALLNAPNVAIDANDAPDEAVDTAPPGTSFIVMTHDHSRDLDLAERILRRGDFVFFGMIGSHTKRKQFEHRLAARGIDPMQIARMNCPLGVDGIVDKSPEVIAVSAAAQLLQAIEAAKPASAAHAPSPHSA